jgi:uroporphyrinogen-III synthase
MKLLIVRPQPGADETARRARALGLEAIVAPLFALRALDWAPPDPAGFDAVLLTSANAARLGGPGLQPFLALPCYAVGERTAAAARVAGFAEVRTGPADGAALAAMAERDGAGKMLRLGGRDHAALERTTHVAVYASDAAGALPVDLEEAVILLHSPRAASRVSGLIADRGSFAIAAISAQAAQAAGAGWKKVAIAAAPRDEALLELAAKLCQT